MKSTQEKRASQNTEQTRDHQGSHCSLLMPSRVTILVACEGYYGEKTGNGYCSHEELKYAREKKIPILVVRMCVKWPPTPKPSKHDPYGLGASLNKFVFSQKGLCTLRWHDREWNADECAKEIEEAFINQRDASSSQAIQVPTNNVLPTTVLWKQSTNRAVHWTRSLIIKLMLALHHIAPSTFHDTSPFAVIHSHLRHGTKTQDSKGGGL
jgi:hypothetical protein